MRAAHSFNVFVPVPHCYHGKSARKSQIPAQSRLQIKTLTGPVKFQTRRLNIVSIVGLGLSGRCNAAIVSPIDVEPLMNNFRLLMCLVLLALPCAGAASLETGFAQPPSDCRPWVYWFWLNGNITSNGITADLEAMKRVGIGGVLIMEVDQGAPVGAVDFMGQKWRDLFRHVHSEARRLGLEVNMNNDAGWNGSGGPWIKPEQSMQKVVWTETNVVGPAKCEITLPQPESVAGFYRDIAVLAFPKVGDLRIPGIRAKAMFDIGPGPAMTQQELPPESLISPDRIVDLTAKMNPTGRLTWEVPDGHWTILRLGHTSTGVENAPAPASGRGLECDKLSKEGIEANFAGMMAKLALDNQLQLEIRPTSHANPATMERHGKLNAEPGSNVSRDRADKSRFGLVATHIDSWENGSQNWTSQMRDEFKRRRGYDLWPFLPVFTGRVVGSPDVSDRFLWDLRQTISELVIENYAGRMLQLAHAHGMRFTVEAYGGPCDAIPYGGQADEPMGEFWTPSGAVETCRGMASAGHVYGKRIIGAEAFTSGDHERWLEHPAVLKAHGDRAFCEGINRFVFHRYAMQPWSREYKPGMTMGPWGQHYERTQTWWDWTPAWHTYLARCQFMLRQGLFVADICRVQAEAPPQGFGYYERSGYDWDECDAGAVITRMSVKNGRIVLPDGMSYRVLVLPWTDRMTPRLLRKVKELVEAGATVIGPKPSRSPSLSGYPQCDAEVKQLAAELWGSADGQTVLENRVGLGRIVWSSSPEKVLADSGVALDFTSDQPLRWIHRSTAGAEIYFVANLQPHAFVSKCSFRVAGRIPELWWPDTGRIERAAMWEEQRGVTRVVIPFEPSGSVFVVFRAPSDKTGAVRLVTRDGKPVFSTAPGPMTRVVIRKALYGLLDDPARTRDVTAKVQRKVDAGEFRFPAMMMAEGDDPAPEVVKTLVVDYEIDGRSFRVKAQDPATVNISRSAIQIAVEKARYGVLDDPARTRDVRDKVQRLVDAGETSFKVALMAQGDDPAFLVVKTLELEYTMNGQRHRVSGTDPDIIDLVRVEPAPTPPAMVRCDAKGRALLEVGEPGDYTILTDAGTTRRVRVTDVPLQMHVDGPWHVRFAPGWGAPSETTFDKLISWSAHENPGIKHFSGEATYTTTFTVPRKMLAKDQRLYLDLGKVAVMAKVKLNGQNICTLWKPPFAIDITKHARVGQNTLEVAVVNLWPNRLIGDEHLPEDSERYENGTLKRWPQWVLENKTSPTGRFTFTTWRLWKKTEPLLDSGLLGPVSLRVTKISR